MRLIFMGSPEFAVPSLDKLVRSRHQIAGVVTVPDKPKGRGRKLSESAVKTFAGEHGLKVFTPANLKDEGLVGALRELSPDLMVVVAFRILPEAVFTIPPKGTINLHASLLPNTGARLPSTGP